MPAPELEPDFAETRARTVTLPTSAASPWLARQLLAQWCREWSVAGAVVDEVMVVISELVTECVAAGAPVVSLQATLAAEQLELAVTGSAGLSPLVDAEDDAAERRMEMVRGLVSSVEVRPGPDGRTIVVTVPLIRAP